MHHLAELRKRPCGQKEMELQAGGNSKHRSESWKLSSITCILDTAIVPRKLRMGPTLAVQSPTRVEDHNHRRMSIFPPLLLFLDFVLAVL